MAKALVGYGRNFESHHPKDFPVNAESVSPKGKVRFRVVSVSGELSNSFFGREGGGNDHEPVRQCRCRPHGLNVIWKMLQHGA
jgi:hypothetical protein